MTKDGERAFPSDSREARQFAGMTLRDYFAGQALFLAQKYWENNVDWIAERAYQIADAMIAEGSN